MEFIVGIMIGSLITTVVLLMGMGSTEIDRYEGFDDTKSKLRRLNFNKCSERGHCNVRP